MGLRKHSTHRTTDGLRFFHGGLACGQENPGALNLDPEDVRGAYTHLRGAQAGDPGVDLQQAIAAFKKMGATAYLAEAEQLLKATA